MTYYTLTDPAPEVGSMLGVDEPEDTYIAADSRALPVAEMTDSWERYYQSAAEVAQSGSLTLVRVEPAGDVEGPDDFNCYAAAGGWTVAGIESSVDAVLGPQAAQVRAVVAAAEKSLTGGGDREDAYIEAVNSHWLPGAHRPGVQPHIDAAEAALKTVGAGDLCWTGCVYGWELLALAARDLIGTTPGWTQEAYDALTEPWRLVMDLPLHPDDQAPSCPQ